MNLNGIKNTAKNTFMTPLLRFLALSLIILFAGTADLLAQNGGFAGAYSRMGFGPRGMGMGNAMTAVHQQGVFAHYNPALASTVRRSEFDFSSSLMSFDRRLNTVNLAFQVPPNAGINIGLLHAGVSDFDGRTTSGVPTDKFSTNEISMFVAFGLNPGERFSLGFSAKLLYADYFDNVDSPLGFGLDLGFLYRVNDNLSFGGAIQDLFSSYTWTTADLFGSNLASRTDRFPTRFKIGAAYDFSQYDLLLSAEFETRSQRSELIERVIDESQGRPRVRTTTGDITTGSSQFRTGAAYGIHERVEIRGGWEIGDLTHVSESHRPSASFSLMLPLRNFDSYIDYTFIREPEGISYMHVFALRIEL